MDLVFATHNLNKVEEVKLLLPKHINLLSLSDIGCDEAIPETENTLKGNALLKANYVRSKYSINCFADDTGLLVDALDGAPGVYSARYAGKDNNAEANISKLLSELKHAANRTAHFKTVIALHWQGKSHLFSGTVYGVITSEVRGKGGFGYDPVFVPEGYEHTFAELPMEVKNKISHRGKALKELLQFLASDAAK